MQILFYFAFVLLNLSAHAALRCEDLVFDFRLRSDQVIETPDANLGPGFIVPNERDIGIHKDLFAKMAEGIYLTVGTERGLMSSALANGKIKALIQVDLDPKVVLYNRVNRALLAGAKNREDYLRLRLKSTHADWLQLIAQSKELSGEDRQALADLKNWQWWQEKVQTLPDWNRFHQDPKQNEDRAYLHANYLFDDILFARVSQLAKQRRIFVIYDSFGKESLKHRVEGIAKALNLTLSAIDMSNAWQEGYLGHQNTIKFLESLQQQMKADSHIVFTYLAQADSRLYTSSVFKFSFMTLGFHSNLSEVGHMLANMARAEPSKTSNQRSRVNRFDDY